MKGYVYILESPNCKRPYLGSTTDISKRLAEHNKGTTKSTKNKGPWRLIKFWKFDAITEAKKIENIIKKRKIKISEESVDRVVRASRH